MVAARWVVAAVLVFASSSIAFAAETPPGDVKIMDGAIAGPLTDAQADAAAGRKYFANRKLGNCLACHANSEMSEHLFHGEVGPTLDGVASRYERAELRAIMVDAKAVFGPETVMPGFYSLNVGKNVRKSLVGKTILTAEQVEAIVDYLMTLK